MRTSKTSMEVDTLLVGPEKLKLNVELKVVLHWQSTRLLVEGKGNNP